MALANPESLSRLYNVLKDTERTNGSILKKNPRAWVSELITKDGRYATISRIIDANKLPEGAVRVFDDSELAAINAALHILSKRGLIETMENNLIKSVNLAGISKFIDQIIESEVPSEHSPASDDQIIDDLTSG